MSTPINKNNARLMDTVFNSMDQGLIVVLADMSVPIVNTRAAELADCPASFTDNPPTFPEMLAYQVEIGAITQAYMDSTINNFILNGQEMEETHTYTRKTKTDRWLDVRTTPLPGGGFVRTFTDQTDRQKLTEAKEQSEQSYKALFETASIGIYKLARDGTPLRYNPELVQLHGYHSEVDMLRVGKSLLGECDVDGARREVFLEILKRDGRVTDFESEIYRHLTRERIWVSESAWLSRGSEGETVGIEGTVVEVTERKRLESLVKYAAEHDALTGLPNRAQFNRVLDDALKSDREFFVAYLDLDGFKAVNDTYGHGQGDNLLIAIAGRFSSVLPSTEPVYRMGGDEFAIILFTDTLAHARGALARLIDAITNPFQLGNVSIEIGVSIGVASSLSGEDASGILHLADTGLYRSKLIDGPAISFEGPGTEDYVYKAAQEATLAVGE